MEMNIIATVICMLSTLLTQVLSISSIHTDEPIYIDPMTYQQQQQQQQANSINVASNAAIQMDFRQNLAQSYRCANADCANCRNSMGKS